MPGTLHVSVLEAVGLPAGDNGSSNFVSVKVSLGEQEFVTKPKRPHRGKTAPWNSDFAFPVLNLADRLFVAVCDTTGVVVSSIAIDVPTTVQEWFREDYVSLDEGGHIHLKLNFVLTKEERQRLESRRAAADRREHQNRRDDMLRLYDFKRKEDQCVNNGLRTIAENALEHKGQPLDNWEVFSKKKGKESEDRSDGVPKSMTCVQDLKQGEMVSSRDWEYLQVVPTAKELLRNTVRGAPHGMKDISMQLPRIGEQTFAPKPASDMQAPRLREGKLRSLHSPPSHNMVEPGLQQQSYNPGSSAYKAQGTSKLTNAWVRVETNSSLKSEDSSAKANSGSKLLAAQTPASVDGWVCVERPPMTWEDALKVARKARETVVAAKSASSTPTNPPEPSSVAIHVASPASGKINTSSQSLPRQGAPCSPLPLLPKQSPSRISSGCVKARISAFESSVHQEPDVSMPKLENDQVQAETSPPRTGVAARHERTAGEKLENWEDGARNDEPASQNSTDGEGYGEANNDLGKGVSREASSRDSIAIDKEPILPDGCQLSRFDKPSATGMLDSKLTRNLTRLGESGHTGTAWRLPEPQDINVEALENYLKQNSITKDNFISAAEEKLSPMAQECGNFVDQMNCRLISHIQESEAVEELGDTVEEETFAAESSLPIEEKTVITKNIAYQDSKVAPRHVESHHFSKEKRSRNAMTNPKSARSDLQTLPRSGDSLQAWKNLQDSIHPARKTFLIKSRDDQFATAARQVDIIFKENSSAVLKHQDSIPGPTASCGDKFHRSGDVSSVNDSKILSHLGSGVKQVLSGAVILAGLFALWPKNVGPVARYHVVKAGETLSSIAPGQCTDPSSNFCRINPRVCDQKTIYPGQRIRLP